MDNSYLAASDGTGDAALMHVNATRLPGATIIQVDSVVGVPAKFIATYGTVAADGFIDPATKRDFYGHVNAGTLVIDGFAPGNGDGGNVSGQIVIIKPNTPWTNLVAQAIVAGSAFPALFSNFVEPGGAVWTQTSGLIGQMSAGFAWLSGNRYALTAIASKTFTASKDTYIDILPSTNVVTYVAQNNGLVEPALTAGCVRVAKVVTSGSAITSVDSSNYTQPIGKEALFAKAVDPILRDSENGGGPWVASGMVWSGDGYASSLNASMTAGVVYINGRRIAIAKVTAHAFTASKDTYIDVLDNLDGTGTVVFTAVSNGATTGFTLAANSVRIGKIVTGASNIAASTSVIQYGADLLGSAIFPTSTYAPSTPWVAPTLLNSWVNYGSGNYDTAGYYKDAQGYVHIRGFIKNGTASAGTQLFVLPVGYRPGGNTYQPCIASPGSAVAAVQLDPTGPVTFVAGNNTYFSLGHIVFRAEN